MLRVSDLREFQLRKQLQGQKIRRKQRKTNKAKILKRANVAKISVFSDVRLPYT